MSNLFQVELPQKNTRQELRNCLDESDRVDEYNPHQIPPDIQIAENHRVIISKLKNPESQLNKYDGTCKRTINYQKMPMLHAAPRTKAFRRIHMQSCGC